MNKKTQQTDNDPYADCVLHQKARSGEKWFEYSYPQNGLPELTGKPAPMRAIFANLCEQQKKSGKQ